jgi:hypothetical protein
MSANSKSIQSLPRLLERDAAVLPDVDQLVTSLAMRADEVDAEAVDAGLDIADRYFGSATYAFPHGDLHRGFSRIVA